MFHRYDFDEYLHNSELQGWLKKKDNKGAMSSAIGISGWKKKWFTLQEQRLIYYPSIQERFTLGKGNRIYISFYFQSLSKCSEIPK